MLSRAKNVIVNGLMDFDSYAMLLLVEMFACCLMLLVFVRWHMQLQRDH